MDPAGRSFVEMHSQIEAKMPPRQAFLTASGTFYGIFNVALGLLLVVNRV
jgi:hypothetical protein